MQPLYVIFFVWIFLTRPSFVSFTCFHFSSVRIPFWKEINTYCICWQKQFKILVTSPYYLHFEEDIRKSHSKLQFVSNTEARNNHRQLNLWKECRVLLIPPRKEEHFIFTWPSFLFNLLNGSHVSKMSGTFHYFRCYSGEQLWSLILTSMRKWWIHVIARINDTGLCPYSQCMLEHPTPVFEYATTRIETFNSNFDAGDVQGYIKAVKNKSVMLA